MGTVDLFDFWRGLRKERMDAQSPSSNKMVLIPGGVEMGNGYLRN